MPTAMYGIVITAITVFFMKILLAPIIVSTFQYVINPTIWSRVASDINAQVNAPSTPTAAQRAELQSDRDIRDVNVSKALDLANQQMRLILVQKKIELPQQLLPSGIEMVAVNESPDEDDTSRSDLSAGAAFSIAEQLEMSDENLSKSDISPISSNAVTASPLSDSLAGSTNSFEAFQLDDIALSAKLKDSAITLPSTANDSVRTTVSIGDSQSSENPSECSATPSTTSSKQSNDKCVHGLNDGTTSSDSDSVEILSISSGTASS